MNAEMYIDLEYAPLHFSIQKVTNKFHSYFIFESHEVIIFAINVDFKTKNRKEMYIWQSTRKNWMKIYAVRWNMDLLYSAANGNQGSSVS